MRISDWSSDVCSSDLIAILTTLATPGVVSYATIIVAILIGGAIGTFIDLRIKMTALPQLVEAFHSLVGLAAVFVAAAAFFRQAPYGIGVSGATKIASLIPWSLGVSIDTITFSGSRLAFATIQPI